MTVELFPQIEPFDSGYLQLDDLHAMYFEQSGRIDGVAALFLHGGPGSGSHPDNRRLFDPAAYRIVVYDQRGAGRSRPLGETRRNTTSLLIEDIERLRRHLGIERWLVLGGSWGSTLALAYAQTHPQRCAGLILRGIFLAKPSEIDWFVNGMGTIFPEAWTAFADFIPSQERGDLLAAYHRRLSNPDPATHVPAARAWSLYEGSCATLLPSAESLAVFQNDAVALGIGRIEAHYFVNETYFQTRPILQHIAAIADIPAIVIQGRYDIICPIVTANALARAWPQARYVIVADAGHLEGEPGIRAANIGATERFKNGLAF